MSIRNRYLVGFGKSDHIVVALAGPLSSPGLTPDEALELAAFVVAIAEPRASRKFTEVLEEVKRPDE